MTQKHYKDQFDFSGFGSYMALDRRLEMSGMDIC